MRPSICERCKKRETHTNWVGEVTLMIETKGVEEYMCEICFLEQKIKDKDPRYNIELIKKEVEKLKEKEKV